MAGAIELTQNDMSSEPKGESDGHVCICLSLFVITQIKLMELDKITSSLQYFYPAVPYMCIR